MSVQYELDAAGDLTYASIRVEQRLLLKRPDLHAVLLGYSFSENMRLSKEEAVPLLRALCVQVYDLGGINVQIVNDEQATIEIGEAQCTLH
jgi:hypothetical protein